MLTIECKCKTRICIGTVQCAPIRRTKISYRILTALVWVPWTSVLDTTCINIIHNYKSRNSCGHYDIGPQELEKGEEVETMKGLRNW